jgi:hypothetical protein
MTAPTCCNEDCGLPMEERPASRMTPEQAWCGTWYDHPRSTLCGQGWSSVLIPSPALQAQLAEQRAAVAAREAQGALFPCPN